jgi:hypothetical protein
VVARVDGTGSLNVPVAHQPQPETGQREAKPHAGGAHGVQQPRIA